MNRRMYWKAGTAALLLCAALASGAAAAKIHPSAGSTSAAFLKLGAGARAAALGGAFVAVPGDPFSLYWNPAGLAYSGPDKELGFYHNEYLRGLGQEYLAFTAPSRNGALGLSLNYFYTSSDLEKRSGLNESDPLNPISPPEGEFGAYDLALSGGYGWRAPGGYALGFAVKAIRQSIDNERGASAALDLGALREFSWRGGEYTAGLSAQNLGPGIKFERRRYDLPLVFRAGLSRRFGAGGALLSLEADKPVDNYPSVALGAEYPLAGRLELRTGYRYRLYGNELGAWSGFSAGAGVAFDRLTFDYAFTPFGTLGNSHRFAITLRFGPPSAGAAPAPASPAAGGGGFAFAASARPLAISPRGAVYEIRAVSPDCGLASLFFRTLVRGEAPVSLAVKEEAPSGLLLAGFPEGTLPLKVWTPDGLPGSLRGDLRFEFRVPKAAAGAGRPAFFYRKGDKWVEAPAEPREAEREDYLYSAAAPAAPHYALGLRP